MKNIIFKPWKGKNYGQTELGRLLIIGDSHYFLNDESASDFPEFTNDIIGDLENLNFKIYINIGKIFNADDELEIWDKVAFANAIQVPFRDPYQKPTQEDFDTVEPAIQEYLNILKPDKMIVFSKRVWNDGLKSDINWGEHVGDIEENNKKSTVWKFNYENGFCHGIGINHASSRGFSPQNWKPLIDKFLNEQY